MQTIRLGTQGHTAPQVARPRGVERTSVYNRICGWNEQQEEGLKEGHRSGRPALLGAAQRQRLLDVVDSGSIAWGLYDMHGNVWEWCLDGWRYFLPGGKVTDPLTPVGSADRVLRGGCWYNEARYCRAAYRSPCDTAYVSHEVGFRVVLAREK